MANPYTSVSVSGYNASAPSDDGARTANNQVKWASIKQKIGDPLKTAIEAVDARALAAFALGFGNDFTAIGADYSLQASDQGALLYVTGQTTISLLQAATAGAVFTFGAYNAGTATVSLIPSGAETINGQTGLYLGPGESAVLVCSGGAWAAMVSRAFPSQSQAKSTTYAVVLSDNGTLLSCTGTFTVSLPAAATAGSAFRLAVTNTGSGLVTLDGSGAETINGATTLGLYPGDSITLICDATQWTAFGRMNGEQTKRKAADETINNSSTIQDDDHLTGYQLEAGALYELDGYVYVLGNNTAQAKVALTFSDAPQSFSWSMISCDSNLNLRSTVMGVTPGGVLLVIGTTAGGTTPGMAQIKGMVRGNATTGGTMKLQWSQNAADPSDTVFKQDSWLRLRKIA